MTDNAIVPNYAMMDAPTMLKAVGDDAQKWAAAFQQIVMDRGITIDEGLMIGWFANAIEHSSDTRRWRAEAAELEAARGGKGE